jgi:spore coat protein U-like protein
MLAYLRCVKTLTPICYLAWITTALAGTSTATFNVTATVQTACTVTASNLNFGTYTLGQSLGATTTLNVTCTNTTPYSVGLDQGQGSGATVNTRIMNQTSPSGSGTLNYSLYQDTNHNTVWGNTIGTGGNTVAGTGNGNAQSATVYGLIFANNPNAIPASYQDTITATVTF